MAGRHASGLTPNSSLTEALAWGLVDNRPFLRCLHGYALSLWRLARFPDAEQVLDRMLWLNPSDNQGARIILPEVQAGKAWEPDQR